jgi:hypothetical protein
MTNPMPIPVPSPSQISGALFPNGVVAPITLDPAWTAQLLLTPFGGEQGNATANPSDQLAVANLTYQQTPSGQLMRVSMYLVESLHYVDFLFSTTAQGSQWWWLVSDPQNPAAMPSTAMGPYACKATVPPHDLMAVGGFTNVGTWNVHNEPCIAFSQKKLGACAATWYWFDAQSHRISRIMNVDDGNDLAIPVLGAYYLVDFPAVQTLAQSNLVQLLGLCPQGPNQPGFSPMRSLADIALAMRETPAGPPVACTPAQLQAIIPGLSFPGPGASPPPPAWTNQVSSMCYMIGQDPYPYYSQVWYDWDAGMQVTVFVTQDQSGDYTQRQDMYLPKGKVGPAANASWSGTEWTLDSCTPGGGVVPMSVPDFVKADEGACRAVISDNPYFGTLSVWSVHLPGDTQPQTMSNFWYWFNQQQQGVVFSLAPASSLTMIDYQTFVQEGAIAPAYLQDGCASAAPSNAACKAQFGSAKGSRP